MNNHGIILAKLLLGISISEVNAFWSTEDPPMKTSASILPIKDEFFHGVSIFASDSFEQFVIDMQE